MVEQRAGHSCCQCAWTSDGGMLTDDPECGTAPLRIYDGPLQSAWCKSHLDSNTILNVMSTHRSHQCVIACIEDPQCNVSYWEANRTCSLFAADCESRNGVLLDTAEGDTYIKGHLWQIALKANAGNGDDVYSVWTQDGSSDGGPGCSSDPTVKCSRTYKSSNVDYWEGVSQVKVEMYTNGTMVAFVEFEGIGSDKSSWFSLRRLRNSTWSNEIVEFVKTSSLVVSMAGFSGRGASAHFVINSEVDCDIMHCNDGGWMQIIDIHAPYRGCSEPHPQTTGPLLRYSTQGKEVLFTTNNGSFLTWGPTKTLYNITQSEYESVCVNLGAEMLSQEELMVEQRAGHSCCQCAWTSDGGMLILQTDEPGCGTAPLQICNWQRQSAWCKSHPGEADTFVIYVR